MKMVVLGMKILLSMQLKMVVLIALKAYAHKNDCPWDERTFGENLDCL